MNCNQCGKEIPENSVFCPFCGVPQKVTADYDYIQGEIGANVDKIKTGDVRRGAENNRRSKPRHENSDLYKTRNVYGNDTIYEDRGRNTNRYSGRRMYEEPYREYEEEDYYEYEDWGIEPAKVKTNGKTILTTVIIAIICLAGIAAIIYFGLKPQAKNQVADVIRCYNLNNEEVSEGDEFEGKLEVVLTSEQGFAIRYTLDGADVDENATLYEGPITSEKEGTIVIKALSFDENGKASGDGLSRALVVKEEETTTKEETTAARERTEGAITKEEAEKIVENALVESNAMNADYSTDDGGFINLIHAGETDIDGVDFYVVQADYYDAEGNIWESSYYGVNMQEGTLSYLDKQDDIYLIVE